MLKSKIIGISLYSGNYYWYKDNKINLDIDSTKLNVTTTIETDLPAILREFDAILEIKQTEVTSNNTLLFYVKLSSSKAYNNIVNYLKTNKAKMLFVCLRKTANKKMFIIIALLCLFGFSGCDDGDGGNPPEPPTDSLKNSLAGTWKLIAFVENDIPRTPEPDDMELIFGDSLVDINTMMGFDSMVSLKCYKIGGTYSIYSLYGYCLPPDTNTNILFAQIGTRTKINIVGEDAFLFDKIMRRMIIYPTKFELLDDELKLYYYNTTLMFYESEKYRDEDYLLFKRIEVYE